ncbi:MAG: tRNA (cytidine(56)-2'-O)-methyltransferase [Thermoproteota archaeon]|nr:tRNA (cytidine(56)-2'-O)-methyltransferase [Candidatus Brockarchaeota archaeon]
MSGNAFEIGVLRLGHRIIRDKRVTMHAFLVSRAFGASVFIVHGDKDSKLEENANKIIRTWGGRIKIEYAENWLEVVREWKEAGGLIAHLTMYGMPVESILDNIRRSRRILVVIGGQKVPSEAYKVSDYNVSITNQPHSEIAALAIFLDRVFQGRELYKQHENPRIFIVPSPRGKVICRNPLYKDDSIGRR